MTYFSFNPYVHLDGVPDFEAPPNSHFGYNITKGGFLKVKNSKLLRKEEYISCIVYAVDSLAMVLRQIHRDMNVLSYFPLRSRMIKRSDNSEFRSDWKDVVDGSNKLVKLAPKTYNFNQIEFFSTIGEQPIPVPQEKLLPLIQNSLIVAGVPLALLDLTDESVKLNEETGLYGLYNYDLIDVTDRRKAYETVLTGFPVGTLVSPSFLWLTAGLIREANSLRVDKVINYNEAIEIIRKRDVKELIKLFTKIWGKSQEIITGFHQSPYSNRGEGQSTFLALVAQGGFYSRFRGYTVQQNRWFSNNKRSFKPHGESLLSWESFVNFDHIRDITPNYKSVLDLDPVKIKDKAEECYAKVKNSRFKAKREVSAV